MEKQFGGTKKTTSDRIFYLGVMLAITLPVVGYYTYQYVAGNTQIAATITTNTDLESGLVGHWTFDGDAISTSSVLDRGSGSNNGSFYEDVPASSISVVTSPTRQTSSSQNNTISTVDAGTGDNRYLVVGVAGVNFSGGGDLNISTLTYDGTSLTQLALVDDVDHTIGLYGLRNPSSGTNDLVVNFSDTPNSSVIGWEAFSGVEQGSSDTDAVRDSGTDTGGSDSCTVALSGLSAGDYLILFGDDESMSNNPTGGITQDYIDGSGLFFAAYGHLTATTTSHTIGFSMNDFDTECAAIGILPFSGGPTLANSTTRPGRIGQGLYFDGTADYYTDLGDLGAGLRTVAFWMKTASTTQKIINIDGTDQIEVVNGTITATSFPANTIYVDGVQASTITAGNWHHVVITMSGGVDGSTFELGRVSPNHYDGILDDVRVYSRVLSASEIQRLYQLGATTKIATTITTNSDLENGLVGHWTFDGDVITRITDSSNEGNHGFFFNDNSTTCQSFDGATSTKATQGKVGQAVDFSVPTSTNFAGGICIPNAAALNALDDTVTVAYWLKADVNPIDFTGYLWKVSGGEGWQFGQNGSNPLTFLRIDTDAGANQTTLINDTVYDNTWHHIVWVIDQGNVDAYVDGTFSTNDSYSHGNGIGNTADLLIGRAGSNEETLDGSLDDIRIYNRALSPDEVRRLYDLGATTKIASTITSNADLENGLVGHWTFDGKNIDWSSSTAEILDRGSFGNNGDANFTQVASHPGRIGQGMNLDGSDDIVIMNGTEDMYESVPMTVSVWFRLDELPSDRSEAASVVYKRHQFGPYFSSWDLFVTTSDDIRWGMTNSVPNDFAFVDSDASAVAGEWYHAVGTVDASYNLRLYINGVLQSGSDNPGSIFDSNLPLAFGAFNSTPGNSHIDGIIDDVRVYNRALSASEIVRLYQLGR